MGQRRVQDTVVGTTEAGEILGMKPPNVAKALERYGVPFQTLVVGKREMKVYLRDDVERVARNRAKG